MDLDSLDAVSADGSERILRAALLEQIGESLDQLVVPDLQGKPSAVVVDLILRLVARMRAWDTDYAGLDAIRRAEQAAPAEADALACLERLWNAEWRFRDRLDPEVRTGRASLYGGGALPREPGQSREDAAGPADEPTITAAKLQAYLRGTRWPDATVEHFALLPGGFGKETSRAQVRTADGLHDIVLRRDLPTSPNGRLVQDEHAVIRAAFDAGIAVAEPLWLEAGPVFETPFLVSRVVPGGNDPAPWRDRPDRVAVFAEELGRTLAGVHCLAPPPELADDRPTRAHIEEELDTYGRMLAERDDAPSPLLSASFAWLRANVPESGVNPRLLHGDVGFHNMLMRDGHVMALIDWEYAHLGDPQQELNYVRPFVDELGAWDAFLAAYRRHGGVAYREEDRRFWQSWTGIRTSIGCVGAMRAFEAGQFANPDAALKLAVAGLHFGPRHLLYSVQELLGAPTPSTGTKA